ncbi:hypothetical protein ICV01_01620 [Polynucleobacter sp. MWH-Spelu-300-X4]|uniref:hypothetical protein n=1 Tax=Polynucleobacter sp. MWH-Spelu-300-X4 TaxID=2689109 RepID=UPI001BFDDA62|nr:hypothetical protein [Polynucleobacter sp. MWH-Spelu-300-X4]QWD80043.1 hypothetical protein ICV01_01620 [Polynucleobacter sp. MWH-Spelu-300-X4]
MPEKKYIYPLIIVSGSLVAYIVNFYLLSIYPVNFSEYMIAFGIASICADLGYRTRAIVQERSIHLRELFYNRVAYLALSSILILTIKTIIDIKISIILIVVPEIIIANVIGYAISIYLSTTNRYSESIKTDFISKIISALLRLIIIINGIFLAEVFSENVLYILIAIILTVIVDGFYNKKIKLEWILINFDGYSVSSAIFMFIIWVNYHHLLSILSPKEIRAIGYILTIHSIFYTYFPIIRRNFTSEKINIYFKLFVILTIISGSIILTFDKDMEIGFIFSILLIFIIRFYSVNKEYDFLKLDKYNVIVLHRLALLPTVFLIYKGKVFFSVLLWLIVEFIFIKIKKNDFHIK